MRAVDVSGADIDDPFLFKGESSLRVNGADLVPLVEPDLNRRFPVRGGRPAYAGGVRVRVGRVAMVRDFPAPGTSADLAATRKNPWAPTYPETILSCLHVILNEEWEHHRYAVRDLNAIDAASDA